MLRIFRQSNFGQVAIILLTVILLWTRAFVHPVHPQPVQVFAPLYELIFGWLNDLPRLASTIALLIILFEGVWLNLLLYNYKILNVNNLLPLFLYIAAMSWSYDCLTITPILFVNLMVIAACSQLLSHGGTTLEIKNNFNASFCIGIASMFYIPALSYTIPILFVFAVYKMYRWKHLFIGLSGLIAPLILLFTYAFMVDKLGYYWLLIRADLMSIDIQIADDTSSYQTALNVVYLVILAVTLLRKLGMINESVVFQRINAGVLTLPLIAGVLMLLYSRLFPADTQVSAVTFTFVASGFLLDDRKKKWVGEVTVWIIVACLIVSRILSC